MARTYAARHMAHGGPARIFASMTTPLRSASGRRATLPAVLWLILGLAPQLGAQTGERLILPIGTRVRILDTVGAQVFTGHVLGLQDDTLSVAVGGGSTLVRLPISRFASIEVSEGRDRLHGGAVGAGVGLVAGGLLGAAALGHDEPSGVGTLAGFFAGGVLGSGFGALFGAILAPERWRSIRQSRLLR